jgi:hypothetical protein
MNEMKKNKKLNEEKPILSEELTWKDIEKIVSIKF